ncbi:MAG TPA: indolepyruvate oxidoreductase subunit beta [Bacteroidota bacterium]|nr:indolepyruvate oxidoreductase subunit beta [Bacteroidota bacterium]
MKHDIIVAGVGGQGILSIAAVLDFAALKNNLYVKQAEVHGMSQRGGAVESHLRISDRPIYSDLIPRGNADIIVSVELMEPLRYLPFLSPDGWIVTSTTIEKNIPNYPDVSEITASIQKLPHYKLIDSETLARNAGSARAENMVMLGAISNLIDIPITDLEDGIRFLFAKKDTKVVETNLAALAAGKAAGAIS